MLSVNGWASALSAQGADRYDLVVAATTDVHGRLRAWDYYANAADPTRTLAGAATIVDSLRRANPGRVVLVDGGDLLQGNPLLFVAAKVNQPPVHPAIAAMNVMQYDAAVLGNHEFNYGVPLLKRAVSQAAFPFLAANVRDAGGTPFVAPMTMITRRMPRGGVVRIGIIGGTTPGSMVWDAENLRAARLTITDIIPAVRRSVADARRQRADVIVVLLHSGLNEEATYDTVATQLPSENVAARLPREIDGIDLVVYGHSHRELVDSTINGALLMQPRNWAASVAVASLTMERLRGRWHVAAHRGQSVRVAGHAESPTVLAATTASHQAAVAWVMAPAGRTTVAWRADSARVADMPVTDLVNEIMRRATGADLSATAAFSIDAGLDSGIITIAALSKLYPYENLLRAVKISGAQLRAYLEHSARYYRSLDANGRAPADGIVDPAIPGFNFDVVAGADYTIDLARPLGSRLVRLTVHGRTVAPTDSFTMALNSYRASGGGGYTMLVGAPVVYRRDVDIRQLVIDEVQRVASLGKALIPAEYATRNWTLEPAAARGAAFAEQMRGRQSEASGSAPSPTSRTASVTPPGGRPTGMVRVIAFSDFHAALLPSGEPGRETGGAVALSAAIRRAQRECTGTCRSVVIHAGDLFTGQPASDWDAGRPTVAVMNRLDVAAGALGNHEFDFGQDTLRKRSGELRHRLLAVNVRDRSNRMPPWVRDDTVVSRDGIRIGIVGAAGTHTSTTTKRRNVADLTFVDPAPLISERIRTLRASGAQVVVAVIHDGGRCEAGTATECHGGGIDVAQRLTERPDAFIIGHSHVNVDLRINGFPVVEPASSGRAIQVVDIPLEGGDAVSTLRTIAAADSVGADPMVDSIVRAAVVRVRGRMNRPVATMAVAMPRTGNQYGLGNLVADAARIMGNGDFGAWNNGGIRADVPSGLITYGGVHAISPFGNVLVRLRVRGDQVRAMVERGLLRGRPDIHVSGLLVDFDPARPQWDRVVHLTTSDGTPLVSTRLYTMIINDFMLDDPDNSDRLTSVSQEVLTIRDIDAVAGYLTRQPQPVRSSATPRIRTVAPGGIR
ncbi:MAG: 5'-nucleotidase C-terminal domain-containing protein [Gemmatimonadaceae bacterium]|nr:5'-nucleotidase C-terminal domain-containing protein [Gemmatimonadaceae bacterium]